MTTTTTGLLKKLAEPWLITEPGLDALADIVELHVRGMAAPEIKEALALAGRDETGDDAPYDVRDGMAMIPVEGALYRRRYLMACNQTYGGIARQVAHAAENPAVRATVLLVDSPGGGVHGVSELASAIEQADGKKPVYAYATGTMASAAYWIGSSCRRIGASPQSSVGSINTVMMHTDRSEKDKTEGIKRTFLSPGTLKAAGNDAEPLSEDAREYLMHNLTMLTDQFIDQVARGRHMSRAKVEKIADGRTFLAEEARKNGLVDSVSSLTDFINAISQEQIMNLSELKAAHPDLMTEARAEWAKEQDATQTAAVTAERDRVLALADAVYGADASRLKAVAEAGVTAEQVRALSGVLQPAAQEQDTKAEMLAAIQTAHSEGVAAGGAGGQDKVTGMAAYAREKYGN